MDNNNKNPNVQSVPGNYICIRNKYLNLDELVNKKLFDKAYIAGLCKEMQFAEPYQHIVTQDWFSPTLLELVNEEFENFEKINWKKVHSKKQNTYRSKTRTVYGPATNLYFSIVNSGWFLDLLSKVSKINDLIADPLLHGGGLHETRNGGGFGIHADFSCHISTGLRNEMVFITYLNKNWNPSWDGALELWHPETQQCVKKIEPYFGQAVLMRNGPKNFHGHPTPLNAPPGISRRSIASYYYTNPLAKEMCEQQIATQYLTPDLQLFSIGIRSYSRVSNIVKMFVPPIIWDAIKKFIVQH